MIERLYIAADGEIKLFEAESRYVLEATVEPPEGEPEIVWRHDSLTGLNLPFMNSGEREYERIEPITANLEKGIRRLLEERDAAWDLLMRAGLRDCP